MENIKVFCNINISLWRAEGLSSIIISKGTDICSLNVTDILKDRGDRHLKVKCDRHFERKGGQTSECNM